VEVISTQLAESSIHADTRGNLGELAEGTGGALLPGSLDLREPLRRALEEVRTHYELTYSPSNTETDGRFRSIEVKVSRPGVTVFARSGYYALPLVNGRQIYPFEVATMKALNSRPLLRQFNFHAAALRFHAGPQRTQYSFALQVPTGDLTIVEEKPWARLHVAITALIKNELGQVVEKISKDIPYQMPAEKIGELRRGAVTFTAPFLLEPGRYTLETAVVDRESMKASVHRSLLVVGQVMGLTMSDVTLVRRVDAVEGPESAADPLQARGGKVIPELSDLVPADSAEKLRFYAAAYPPAPIDAPLTVSMEIARDGKAVMRAPATAVPPERDGAASALLDVPLGKLPSGHYEARVTFHYKGQAVTNGTAFTVEPAN
jgi:hypothetical protein